MFGFRRLWTTHTAQPVVLDTALLRDINRTQQKIDELLSTLPDFQAQLTQLAEAIDKRDPLTGTDHEEGSP